jgi:hypothetical protein
MEQLVPKVQQAPLDFKAPLAQQGKDQQVPLELVPVARLVPQALQVHKD